MPGKLIASPSKLTFVDGILQGNIGGGYDGNQDGKPSVSADINLKVDAAEVVEEIFKTDAAWLMKIISQLQASKVALGN